MGLVSLSYDDNSIRVAQKHGGDYRVGQASLPPKTVIDGVVTNPRSFQVSWRRALRNAGINPERRWRVAVAIPESRVFTKLFEIPRVPTRELAETIYWQAQKVLPAEPDQLAIDYQLISSRHPATQMVLLISAPREVVASLWESLSSQGYLPTLFLPRSIGLAQLIRQKPHTPVLLIEGEDTHGLNLIIAKNQTARFSTSITLESAPRRLLKSITQTIQFYEARDGQQRKVAEIVVLPGPDAPRLVDILTKANVRNVRLFHAPKESTARTKVLDTYLVNLGLLHARTRLNLILPNHRKLLNSRRYDRLRTYLLWLQIEAAILLPLIIGGIIPMQQYQQARIDAATATLAQTTIDPKNIQQDDALLSTLAQTTQLMNKRSSIGRVYEHVTAAQTPEVHITSLNYTADTGNLLVTGQRTSRAAFLQFIEYLRQEFPRLIIPAEAWSEPAGGIFRIEVVVS